MILSDKYETCGAQFLDDMKDVCIGQPNTIIVAATPNKMHTFYIISWLASRLSRIEEGHSMAIFSKFLN